METMREIKRHINTIKTIQKETKAMKAVYAAKLSKTQRKLLSARPYADKLKEVLNRLAAAKDFKHELTEQNDADTVAYVVFTANRGMAGGYSADICRFAERAIKENGKESSIIVIGKKGRNYFRDRGYKILKVYKKLGEDPDFRKAQELTREVVDLFLSGQVGQVVLIYAPYFTAIRNQPLQETLLPISREMMAEKNLQNNVEYIYEPGTDEVLASLLPRYLQVYIYKVMLEAKASEYSARMITMGTASDNAGELIKELTLAYNRAHQALITSQIMEITQG